MRELTKYRLNRAMEFLSALKIMLENNCYKDSINRSYYAIFTTIRALLSENEIDLKKIPQLAVIFVRIISRQKFSM